VRVKCSPNSQTDNTMLTSGFTTTSSGWETVSGPTCSAACTSRPLVEPTSTRTYTGHADSSAISPRVLSTSIACLTSVASTAARTAAAIAKPAARRAGEPRRAEQAATAATAPPVSSDHSQADGVAPGWPPRGSAATRKNASETHTSAADPHAALRTGHRLANRRTSRVNTSWVISTGCTTESRPTWRASACRPNATTHTAWPSSHRRSRTR